MRWMRGAIRALAALIVSAVIWEVVLRAFFIVPIVYQYNPALGYMPAPHSRGLHTEEGSGVLSFNELGFRDGPVKPKSAGELRILCLGDSFTEGRQMDVTRTFPARLQQLLNEAGAPSARSRAGTARFIRVLNGGRDGTTPVASIELADGYKAVFQPDWVILVVHDGIWGRIFDPAKEFYYQPVGTGFVLKHHDPHKVRKLSRILHLRELALMQYGFKRWKQMMGTTRSAAGGEGDTATGKRDADPGNPAQTALTGRVIDWSVRALKKRYPRLILVQVPGPSAADNSLLPPQPAERYLIDACRRHNVALVNLRQKIEQAYARSQRPPFGFANTLPWRGHPNAYGHELIAQAVCDQLADKLSASPPHSPNSQ